MASLAGLYAHLLTGGCTPSTRSFIKPVPVTPNDGTALASAPENGNGNHPAAASNGSWYPIHNVEMKPWMS
ncbi:MAG: hypothetical protein MUO62_15880, partial [Anaerolineales bacterium]|nr:hypothetical protein [Anaerolineales bacterium]